jgi:hypothetical protein
MWSDNMLRLWRLLCDVDAMKDAVQHSRLLGVLVSLHSALLCVVLTRKVCVYSVGLPVLSGCAFASIGRSVRVCLRVFVVSQDVNYHLPAACLLPQSFQAELTEACVKQ